MPCHAMPRLLILLLGGLLCQLSWAEADVPADLSADIAIAIALGASVLRIEAPRVGGGYAFGSGVMVAADTLVTNCHVTRQAREVHVVRGGARWSATGQVADIAHDLCLLRVPGVEGRAAMLGQAGALKIGQAVSAHGFTGGLSMQHSSGAVVALHSHDGAQVIQASNRFSSGASGGGLFDEQGRLVGILTFRLPGMAAHYFAAPVEWVQQLLSMATPDKFLPIKPLPADQLAYWEQPLNQQPDFLRAAARQDPAAALPSPPARN